MYVRVTCGTGNGEKEYYDQALHIVYNNLPLWYVHSRIEAFRWLKKLRMQSGCCKLRSSTYSVLTDKDRRIRGYEFIPQAALSLRSGGWKGRFGAGWRWPHSALVRIPSVSYSVSIGGRPRPAGLGRHVM